MDRAINLSGKSPLEFMLDIMQTEPPKEFDPLTKMAWFQLRCEMAKAAAPYVHPRAMPKSETPDVEDYARKAREACSAMDASVGAVDAGNVSSSNGSTAVH